METDTASTEFRRSDVLVVIRTVGERTTALCRALLERQVVTRNIHTINVVPFSKAVVRTFELGIEHQLPWTLAVDADVLIHSHAVHSIVGLAENAPLSDFRLDARLLDKLFGGPRCVGMHLYRTRFLNRALQIAQRMDVVSRPEFHVVSQMRRVGFTETSVGPVLGIHDFEQYYHDLYRKGHVHAKKHQWLLQPLEQMWTRLAETDDDYRAVAAGASDGHLGSGVASTNYDDFSRDLADLGLGDLTEKDSLENDGDLASMIDKLARSSVTEPEFSNVVRLQQDAERSTSAPQLRTTEQTPLSTLRGYLRIRSRVKSLFSTSEVSKAPSETGSRALLPSDDSNSGSFSSRLSTDILDSVSCDLQQQILDSPPMTIAAQQACEVHTVIGASEVPIYVLTVKSLLRFCERVQIVIHDDGSLTEANSETLREHVPGIRIVNRTESDRHMQQVLRDYPTCRHLRSNNFDMARILDVPSFSESSRLILLDSRVLFLDEPVELIEWMSLPDPETLYLGSTIGQNPRFDGVEFGARQDLPFRFADNLSDRLICTNRSSFDLQKIEEYCKFVSMWFNEQQSHAQLIAAFCIGQTNPRVTVLPSEYQAPGTYALRPTMRAYDNSQPARTLFLTDAQAVLADAEFRPGQ